MSEHGPVCETTDCNRKREPHSSFCRQCALDVTKKSRDVAIVYVMACAGMERTKQELLSNMLILFVDDFVKGKIQCPPTK